MYVLATQLVYLRVLNWPWPMKDKNSKPSMMRLNDVQSVYSGRGISDAVIDFYAR